MPGILRVSTCRAVNAARLFDNAAPIALYPPVAGSVYPPFYPPLRRGFACTSMDGVGHLLSRKAQESREIFGQGWKNKDRKKSGRGRSRTYRRRLRAFQRV